MLHRLKRLLSPRSIAIVGASQRQGSLAEKTYRQLVERRFQGKIDLINPRYPQLFDQVCYPTLLALAAVPDLVIFVISGLKLESSFDEALEMGVGGIVIYASNHIEEDTEITLPERLKEKALAAGVPVMGGNSMGFYNYDDRVFVSFDEPPRDRPKGHIGLIVHSGSAMTYTANNDSRFCFNYVIHGGQETNTSVADYMDYLLEQASTRVIALFIETIRDVSLFVASLKKAQQKRIPIVITKLGRTEKSAQFAISHSGAIAGNHDAFKALCERFNVVTAKDIDELITTAMLFSCCAPATTDGVASLLDSGGMREQMIDIAEDYGVRFAQITNETKIKMGRQLEHGLTADNPLDAMGALGRNTQQTYTECGKALLDDADTGLLTYEFEFRDGFSHYPEMFDVIDQLVQYTKKPLIVINSFSFSNLAETAASLAQRNIPVVNGIDLALRSIKNFCDYHCADEYCIDRTEFAIDQTTVDSWQIKLSDSTTFTETTSLQLMKDFGLSVVSFTKINNVGDAIGFAKTYGYPLVLKTAMPGVAHKSDSGGVKLALNNKQQLVEAYADLEAKIGPDVVIMPMVQEGIEIALGLKNDPQFGAMIIVSAGGILIELINDSVIALAPVNYSQACELLDRLKVKQLLEGVRGRKRSDIEALLSLIVDFSRLAYALSDSIDEVDLNPVIVQNNGCVIVDALVVPKQP